MSPEGGPDIQGWRLRKQRYCLIGECCPHCDEKIFPPRDICPSCGENTNAEFVFSGKGEVYSYTTIYEAPYTVALVRLKEGPLVTAQLTDLDPNQPVKIGDRVEMVTRKLREDGDTGPITYGYKFRPVLERTQEPARG